jgi:glycine cleavage system aminomethyltransferase T
MTGPTATPIRRSGLDAVHRQSTSARAGTDHPGLRWPMSYGDPDGERRAVTDAVGLAEPGLYDKWVLRGPGAVTACRGAGLEAKPGFVTPAPIGGVNVWTVAADEVWLVAYAPIEGGPPATAVDLGPIVAAAHRSGVHATDVSSGWSVLRLFGPRVRDLLEELVAEDLGPGAWPDLAIAQVPLAGTRVILSRRDADGIAGFTLLAPRDDAEFLWGVFLEIGAGHGIRPVGASALVGASGAASSGAAAGSGR